MIHNTKSLFTILPDRPLQPPECVSQKDFKLAWCFITTRKHLPQAKKKTSCFLPFFSKTASWCHLIKWGGWAIQSKVTYIGIRPKYYKMGLFLKYGFQEKVSYWCRCSIFLSPTFVEIKKCFTKMLLYFNFKIFRIFFSWKKTDKSDLCNVSML